MPASDKYYSQAEDGSGHRLFWPGTTEGYPFRGQPPPLTQEEYDSVPLIYDAKVAILELPKDVDTYQEVIDKCANGWYVLRHEKIDYDASKGVYRVFLQWLETYGESPRKKNQYGRPS